MMGLWHDNRWERTLTRRNGFTKSGLFEFSDLILPQIQQIDQSPITTYYKRAADWLLYHLSKKHKAMAQATGNLVILTTTPNKAHQTKETLVKGEQGLELCPAPKHKNNQNRNTRRRKSRSNSTKQRQSYALGWVEQPKNNHPSHSLLEKDGFQQQTYDKFHDRCING